MPKKKLHYKHRIALLDMVSDGLAKGKSTQEITDKWNERFPESTLTLRGMRYHVTRERRLSLERSTKLIDKTTSLAVLKLARTLDADITTVADWDEEGNVALVPSSELPPRALEGISVRASSDGTIDYKIDANAQVAAAKTLLQYMHGSKLNVTDSSAIVSRLQEANDAVGLERIANGEDPLRVLIDRAAFLGGKGVPIEVGSKSVS